MRDATTRAYDVLKVISVAFGGFFTYQVKEAAEYLLNLLKDYLLQPFFLVDAPNFGPAAAAPAGPAPTALIHVYITVNCLPDRTYSMTMQCIVFIICRIRIEREPCSPDEC